MSRTDPTTFIESRPPRPPASPFRSSPGPPPTAGPTVAAPPGRRKKTAEYASGSAHGVVTLTAPGTLTAPAGRPTARDTRTGPGSAPKPGSAPGRPTARDTRTGPGSAPKPGSAPGRPTAR